MVKFVADFGIFSIPVLVYLYFMFLINIAKQVKNRCETV
jgi:hypothetical protein